MRPACAIADSNGSPCVVQLLGEVEQHDAVLHHQADQQDQPHRRRDVQVGAGEQQQQQRAAERQRRGQQDQQSPAVNARNWITQDREAPARRASAEHHQQLAERLPLRLVLPADLVACSRPAASARASFALDLGDRAAEVAPLEAAGDERHLPQVLAQQLAPARWRASSCATARDRHELAVGACESASAAAWSGSKRNAIRQRTRTGTLRSSSRRSVAHVAEPAAGELVRRPARRSARARPRPPDRSFQVTSGLPRCMPDDVDDAVDLARASPRPARRAPPARSGSSPKILTSIGVGLPSRSPSMSCSSWTNSISASGAASCSFGRRSRDDLLRRSAALRRAASAAPGCRRCSAPSRTGRAPIRCAASTPPLPACLR